MGWNDRLPTDPYLPPDDYYQNGEEEYNARLEYVEMRMRDEGLTSQNIDPARLPEQHRQETPERHNVLSRLWSAVFGEKVSKIEAQEDDAQTPF